MALSIRLRQQETPPPWLRWVTDRLRGYARVWEWLGGAEAAQLVEAPRRVDDQRATSAPAGDGDPQRLASITAAYHAQGRTGLAFVWRRPAVGAPVEVIAAGSAPLPPGPRTSCLPAGELLGRLRDFSCWSSISVRHDGLRSVEADGQRSRSHPRAPAHTSTATLESGLLSVWEGPFVVAVLATPVPAPEFVRRNSCPWSRRPRTWPARRRLGPTPRRTMRWRTTGLGPGTASSAARRVTGCGGWGCSPVAPTSGPPGRWLGSWWRPST
ncbi:hypothetical protein [Actinopolymorpha alba]|uniref:hypothetical protein n=1 Tax=Actinopolymorpha alba TaxID=533267 RepID=UPI00036FC342|nr:hypothetical protein [Actinopolymorpha alba]